MPAEAGGTFGQVVFLVSELSSDLRTEELPTSFEQVFALWFQAAAVLPK